MKNERNYFVDLLKIIAIFFVIFHHGFRYVPSINNQLLYGFPFYIYQGVPIFMILSGFSWTLSLQKNKCESLNQCYKPSFIFKKFLRIFIPYLLIFLLLFTCSICLNEYQGYDWAKGFFIGGLYSGYNCGHYYIPILFEMILFIPIIYQIIKKWNFKGFIALYIFNILFEVIRWATSLPIDSYQYIIFRYTTVLAYGVYLGFNYKNRQNYFLSFLALAIGISSILLFYYSGYKCQFFYSDNWQHSNFLSFLYIIPIIGFLVRKCRLNKKWVSYLGQATFSIFLSQYFVYSFIKYFTFTSNEVSQLFISVGFIVLISIPIYIICEKLATKYCIKLLDWCVNKYRLKHRQK